MLRSRSLFGVVVACASLVSLGGCPFSGNSGCLGLPGFLMKVQAERLSDVSACEWQAVARFISDNNPDVSINVTLEQAQLLQDFLRLNNINTFAQVQAALENPDALQIPPGALELLENLESVVEPKN